MQDFIIGGDYMTKREFATKLLNELEEKQDVQKVVDSIKNVKSNGKKLSVDEQLQIVNLIREIHAKKGLFEDVSAFLALVNQVEAKIKSQNNSQAGGSK